MLDEIRINRSKRFEQCFNLLDMDTKLIVSDFLVSIDENGEHHIGSTIFYGSNYILDSIRDCLNCLSSSIKVEENLDGMNCEHQISWQPSDFIIPDMILNDNAASNHSTPICSDNDELEQDFVLIDI